MFGKKPTPLDPEYWNSSSPSHQYASPFASPSYDSPGLISPTQQSQNFMQGLTMSPIRHPGLTFNANMQPFQQPSPAIHPSPMNYNSKDQLKQKIRERIVQSNVTMDLMSVFQSYDVHRRGSLRRADFEDALMQLGIRLYPHDFDQIMQLFYSIDTDTVNYPAFCQLAQYDTHELYVFIHPAVPNLAHHNCRYDISSGLTSRITDLARQGINVRDSFAQYDTSRSGYLQRDAFIMILRRLGLPVTENTAQALADKFSHLHDRNQVSYVEFLQFAGNPPAVYTPSHSIRSP